MDQQKVWALFIGLTMLVGGLIAIVGSALNLDMFFDSPKAKPVLDALGRTGARIFYVLFGALVAAVGIGVMIVFASGR